MSSNEINPAWNIISIGKGSFATVSILSGRPVAFKHVIFPERTPELRAEFETIRSLYNLCNTNSFFAIPRPLAYFDPAVYASFVSSAASHPRSWDRLRVLRPLVAEDDFKALALDSAAYAMDQVLPLPLSTARIIRKLFYPPGQDAATLPSLCRLYFGKVIEVHPPAGGRPNRFFNSANFPLDVARYSQLLEVGNAADDYPTVDDIASGMGEMLGRSHWLGGYDGRDVEFIMGGASFSDVSMNIIDFNQMRPWSRKTDNVPQLVDAFFSNDPYYPRPRPEDPLYQKFRLSYLDVYPKEHKAAVEIAEAFLHAIEAEQVKRDSAVRM